MANSMKLDIVLGGELQPSFTVAAKDATKQLAGVLKAAEQISAVSQKRLDVKLFVELLSKWSRAPGECVRFAADVFDVLLRFDGVPWSMRSMTGNTCKPTEPNKNSFA